MNFRTSGPHGGAEQRERRSSDRHRGPEGRETAYRRLRKSAGTAWNAGLRPASPAAGGRNRARLSARGAPLSTEAPAEFNQELRAYEQVAKLQRYRLAEGAEEEFDEDFVLRPCDLSLLESSRAADRERFIRELGESLEDTGFAILTGHGVDAALYAEAHRRTRDFFERHSLEEKLPYRARRQGSVNQGYFPMRETTVIHPDLVEGWVFCRRAFDLGENPDWDEAAFWPSPGWEPFFRRVVLAHERLIHPIMQSVLAYLGENPALFDERLTATNFGFRLNYYPPLSGVPEGTTGRMLGHEDVDLFTILPAAETEGLQLLHRKTMKWVRVAAPPGAIVLNTGDYMQRITNNRLPSTTHRVSSPRDPAARMKPRTSFPMAIYVWEDEFLEVLPNQGAPLYPPVRAEDFHTRITSKYYGDSYHTTGEEGAVSRRVR